MSRTGTLDVAADAAYTNCLLKETKYGKASRTIYTESVGCRPA